MIKNNINGHKISALKIMLLIGNQFHISSALYCIRYLYSEETNSPTPIELSPDSEKTERLYFYFSPEYIPCITIYETVFKFFKVTSGHIVVFSSKNT